MTRKQAEKLIAEKMREVRQIVKEFDPDTDYFSVSWFEDDTFYFYNSTSKSSPLVLFPKYVDVIASSLQFNFGIKGEEIYYE